MLDLQFVCDNLETVRANCQHRHVAVDLDNLNQLRESRSQLIVTLDRDRQRQNEIAQAIPKEKSPEARQSLIEQGKTLKQTVPGIETKLKEIEAEIRSILITIPNLTHPDAPIGEEADSKTVRTWGTPPKFDFKPLDHVALAEKHDLIDLEGGGRVAGHGFYFLKNEAVLLELALTQYAVQKLLKHGFTLHTTPDLAKMEVLDGTGYQPRGNETQIYSIAGMDLCLVATAEITLGGLLKDQIVDAKYDLKNRQRQQRGPGIGIGQHLDHGHGSCTG